MQHIKYKTCINVYSMVGQHVQDKIKSSAQLPLAKDPFQTKDQKDIWLPWSWKIRTICRFGLLKVVCLILKKISPSFDIMMRHFIDFCNYQFRAHD